MKIKYLVKRDNEIRAKIEQIEVYYKNLIRIRAAVCSYLVFIKTIT